MWSTEELFLITNVAKPVRPVNRNEVDMKKV
jgi:hypothetical protein